MRSIITPTLDSVCEFIVDCLHNTAPTQALGFPLIRTPNIGKGRLLLDDVFRVSEEVYRIWTQRAIPEPGDLILAREAPAGNVAIVKEGEKVCLGQRTVHLRPNRKIIDPDFLCYFLLAPEQQGKLLAGETGATAKHVNMKDIRKLELSNLPDITTQKTAGNILSTYDDLIENNRRRTMLLEDASRQVYQEWFERLRFPGHEHARIVDGIPEGWARKTLASLCESIDYGYTASAEREEIGPKFLRITDIVPNLINWDSVPFCQIDERKMEKLLLREGDIVIARTGATVGYAKRVHKRHPNAVFASYLVRLRLKPEIINLMVGVFVESVSYKSYVQSHVSGAAQPNANAKVLANAEILVPPHFIQRYFQEFVEPLVDQKEVLQIQNQKLRTARDLLLPKLMSGEISV